MNSTIRVSTHLERQIDERLARHGSRFTPARQRIVTALSRFQGPRSAAELVEATDQGVPISSLYRNLRVLEEAGVVSPHHGAGGLTRYELSEWLSGHHHHLVCTHCGQVDDVELGGDREATLHALAQSAGLELGFLPESHTLEIEGRCHACAAEAAASAGAG